MRKKLILTLLPILISLGVSAQWDSNLSQYWNMKNFYNPSFIGQDNFIEASLLQRNQWVGIKNPPKTSILSLNMPLSFLGKEHGVGFMMLRDKAGLFSSNAYIGQYNYKIDIKKKYRLNIGIMGGQYSNDFDANGIYIPSPENDDNNNTEAPNENDQNNENGTPTIANGSSKAIDGGVGVSWIAPNYYVGLSVNHILMPKISFVEGSERRLKPTIYLTGQYNIRTISSSIALYPSFFYRTNTVVHQLDLTMRGEYKKFVNMGISWRKDDGVIFSLGLKIKNIEAAYSYDWSTSAMGKVSNGSHEIFLKYRMPINKQKVKEPLKSIRIL